MAVPQSPIFESRLFPLSSSPSRSICRVHPTSHRIMDHSTATATITASKTIHLIRHGVARHNVPDAQTGERANLLDPKLTDPSLIRQGELQARVLGEQFRRRGQVVHNNSVNDAVVRCPAALNDFCNRSTAQQQQQPIELVVCSPLTRCLQTASLIFPSHFEQTASAVTGNSTDMHILNRSCRVCCHGDVREAYGMHYPDKRRWEDFFMMSHSVFDTS